MRRVWMPVRVRLRSQVMRGCQIFWKGREVAVDTLIDEDKVQVTMDGRKVTLSRHEYEIVSRRRMDEATN